MKHLLTALPILLFSGCFLYEPVLPRQDRSPAPDLISEIFLLHGLAETLTIINPAYAGEQFFEGELSEQEYVDNGLEYSLEREDYYTGNSGNGVISTGQSPNDILIFDNKLALLSSGDNTLYIKDESTLEDIQEIYLGSGTNPYSMVYSETTSRIYITGFLTSELIVVDPVSGNVILRRDLRTDSGEEITGPEGICIINNRILIACTNWDSSIFGYRPGQVLVYGLSDLSFQEILELETSSTLNLYNTIEGFKWGLNPQALIPFPDRNEVHIVCSGSLGEDQPDAEGWEDYMSSDDGEVIIVDSVTLQIKQRLAVGGSPSWNKGGYHPLYKTVYLSGIAALRGYRLEPTEAVTLTAEGELAGLFSEADGSGYFSSVIADPATNKLFTACFNDDRIAVIQIPSTPEDRYVLLDYIDTPDGPQILYLYREDNS